MKRSPKSAGKLVILKNNDPIAAETESIQSRIRERAYQISQTRGHAGREVDDWISAESEIISVPPVELTEKKNGTYQVRFVVAGITPDDVSVLASTDQVLLKCDFRHNHDADESIIHLCDLKSATIFRSVRFPQPINLKSINIQFEDGLIRLTASKEGVEPGSLKRSSGRKPAARKSTKTRRGARDSAA